MTYKIEKNIPLTNRLTKYPFAEMEVGDSYALETNIFEKTRAAASIYGTRHNKKFTVRRHGDGCRCWRVS